MGNRRRFLSLLAIVLLIASLPVTVFGKGEPKNEPVGKSTHSASMIEWAPSADHEAIEVTVQNGDGEVWTGVFKNGKPAVKVKDLDNGNVDGLYTYQLRLVPRVSNSTKQALAAARESGNDKEAASIMKAAGLNKTVIQTGYFTIQNGAIVSNELSESTARDSAGIGMTTNGTMTAGGGGSGRPGEIETNTQVIPEDLVVQGSECVGIDCTATESFGFDTIRLKENNLRIKFEDTSSSAGFPTTDWQLTANDSASGGASKFSIDDITNATTPFTVEAATPSNSVFIDSTGRVGFRTSTPALDLHVTTSNTPALRFEQTNSGGFTAQTWDVAGNEANFFVRDVTGGSLLPFRIRPGAPTSSLDISADGDIGIGTASPGNKVHVFGGPTTDVLLTLGGDAVNGPAFNFGYGGQTNGRSSGFFNVRPDASATAPNPALRFMTSNTVRMIIDNEGFIGIGTSTNPTSPIEYINGSTTARLTTAGVWQDASSRKAKENITDLESAEALQALRDLKPVKYNYKVAPNDPKVGFIAEDVPEIVAVPDREGLSALDIVGVLTKVVQEQQSTIEKLNERIQQLEEKNQ